jgi:hypothetical protein
MKNTKYIKYIFLFALTALSFAGDAQWSVNLGYGINRYPEFVEENNSRSNEYLLSLERKFAITKNKNSFLVPSFRIGYMLNASGRIFTTSMLGAYRVYPFANGEDCDCPDFGKKNQSILKRFNLTLGGGGMLENTNTDFLQLVGLVYTQVSLDIPIQKVYYVAPFFGFELAGDTREDILETSPKSKKKQLSFGIRLGSYSQKKRR